MPAPIPPAWTACKHDDGRLPECLVCGVNPPTREDMATMQDYVVQVAALAATLGPRMMAVYWAAQRTSREMSAAIDSMIWGSPSSNDEVSP